jgi:speckle-type POZ protein
MASTGCGCSSELSQSASSIAADTARGYHILKIDDYSLTKGTPTGEYLKSHPFTVGGHHWQIRYYPNGFKSEHADFISIYLQHDGSVASLVKAQYEFRFVHNVGEEPVTLQEVTSFARKAGEIDAPQRRFFLRPVRHGRCQRVPRGRGIASEVRLRAPI